MFRRAQSKKEKAPEFLQRLRIIKWDLEHPAIVENELAKVSKHFEDAMFAFNHVLLNFTVPCEIPRNVSSSELKDYQEILEEDYQYYIKNYYIPQNNGEAEFVQNSDSTDIIFKDIEDNVKANGKNVVLKHENLARNFANLLAMRNKLISSMQKLKKNSADNKEIIFDIQNNLIEMLNKLAIVRNTLKLTYFNGNHFALPELKRNFFRISWIDLYNKFTNLISATNEMLILNVHEENSDEFSLFDLNRNVKKLQDRLDQIFHQFGVDEHDENNELDRLKEIIERNKFEIASQKDKIKLLEEKVYEQDKLQLVKQQVLDKTQNVLKTLDYFVSEYINRPNRGFLHRHGETGRGVARLYKSSWKNYTNQIIAGFSSELLLNLKTEKDVMDRFHVILKSIQISFFLTLDKNQLSGQYHPHSFITYLLAYADFLADHINDGGINAITDKYDEKFKNYFEMKYEKDRFSESELKQKFMATSQLK